MSLLIALRPVSIFHFPDFHLMTNIEFQGFLYVEPPVALEPAVLVPVTFLYLRDIDLHRQACQVTILMVG